jgi:conserved oligomeric Golgi complex subunit 2
VTALGTGKLAETDKAKRMADLTECLRTYDALQLWRDAEDVLRRDVLREFVKKVLSYMFLPHVMLNRLNSSTTL